MKVHHKITFDPFGLPFLPIFKLTTENLDISEAGGGAGGEAGDETALTLDINNYGHSGVF